VIGLETILGVVLHQIVDRQVLSMEEALYRLSIAPRRLLKLPVPQIHAGEPANFSLIKPKDTWIVDVKKTRSRSRNSPYDGMTLRGVVTAVVNKGLIWQPNF
jgi:dihydroorotase